MYADNAKAAARAPLTVPGLRKMKADRERIAALPAYDASFARALDAAGVERAVKSGEFPTAEHGYQ